MRHPKHRGIPSMQPTLGVSSLDLGCLPSRAASFVTLPVPRVFPSPTRQRRHTPDHEHKGASRLQRSGDFLESPMTKPVALTDADLEVLSLRVTKGWVIRYDEMRALI